MAILASVHGKELQIAGTCGYAALRLAGFGLNTPPETREYQPFTPPQHSILLIISIITGIRSLFHTGMSQSLSLSALRLSFFLSEIGINQ
jgi:hypothetical protein